MEQRTTKKKLAPDGPGDAPHWTSSRKSGIGKSINSASGVAFTIGSGIINEVFYPREDFACIKDVGCVVTNGKDFYSDERSDTHHTTEWIEEGVPAFRTFNMCLQGRYHIERETITDPIRDTLLQQLRFTQTVADDDLQWYLLLAPHILGKGMGNNAWKGTYKGVPMLFASRKNTTLALALSTDVIKCSVGYAGRSDGYTDLRQHFSMQWEYDEASDGNVVLAAQLPIKSDEQTVIAVGFGESPAEAGNNAWSSLLDGFDLAKDKYVFEWQRWQRRLRSVKSHGNAVGRDFRKSAAVLRIHESRSFPGGIIASLSKPWGEVRGDNDGTGYHMVWPRDLALSSGGFLELDATDDVKRIMNYLFSIQEADGTWYQNMWLAGIPHWTGIQMDQISFPVLMAGAAFKQKQIEPDRVRRYWPGIQKALKYILSYGPYTRQDRWEEEAGYTPFTLATQIAGLLAGALLAEAMGNDILAGYCREVADSWNDSIEAWTYVNDTQICEALQIDGYYIRINPFNRNVNEVKDETIHLKNHGEGSGIAKIGELVSVDALALVRFGLRAADDPRILNTVKVIDHFLKVDTPTGPCWRRYNGDAYGEDEAGNPYPNGGKGKGRAWPLLTGERAHYEIAAGNMHRAIELLRAMESFTNNALLPEQIWDSADIPEKGLYFGRPSGSAMPLTWAHAEYLKLCSSIKRRAITDSPDFTLSRYVRKKNRSALRIWTFANQLLSIVPGQILRLQLDAAANVRWTDDGWISCRDMQTRNFGNGIYFVDIRTEAVQGNIEFTFCWTTVNRWEGRNISVAIQPASGSAIQMRPSQYLEE